MTEPLAEVVPDAAAKARRQRWAMLIVLALLLLALLVVYRFWLERAFEARVEALRAAGEPTTYEELDALRGPAPPDAENSANAYLMAFRRLAFAEEDVENPALRLLGNSSLPIPPSQPYADEEMDTASRFLDKNAPVFVLLDAADALPRFYRPMQVSPAGYVMLPDLETFVHLPRLRLLQSQLAAEFGDAHAALAALRGAAAIESRLESETPFLIVYLIQLTIRREAVDTLERIASRAELPDAELQRLLTLLNRWDNPRTLRAVMAAERVEKVVWVDNILDSSSSSDAQAIFGQGWLGRLNFGGYIALGLHRLDQQAGLDYMGALIQGAELPYPERVGAMAKVDPADFTTDASRIYSQLEGLFMPVLGRAALIEAICTAKVRAAIVALAVERFRLAEGRLPDRLDEMVPRFLPTLPQDPFTGQPLIYKKHTTGFIVYSLGEGGTDDRGVRAGPRVDEGSTGSDIPFEVRR